MAIARDPFSVAVLSCKSSHCKLGFSRKPPTIASMPSMRIPFCGIRTSSRVPSAANASANASDEPFSRRFRPVSWWYGCISHHVGMIRRRSGTKLARDQLTADEHAQATLAAFPFRLFRVLEQCAGNHGAALGTHSVVVEPEYFEGRRVADELEPEETCVVSVHTSAHRGMRHPYALGDG